MGGVLIRLWGISAPPFDSYHSIRQYDTAAIARNFAEEGMNILYPRIDWRGASPGFVESEFPAYTYLVAVLYRAFGVHEWLGRAVNIGIYLLSAVLLFRFTETLASRRGALFAVFVYSVVPMSVFFTRTFQPDALAALCSLAAVYFFWRWGDTSTHEAARTMSLAMSAAALGTAMLIKPMNVYLGAPLFYIAWRRHGRRVLAVPVLWIYAAAVLVPPFLWYRHAFSLWEAYGNTLYRSYTTLSIPPVTDPFWIDYALEVAKRIALHFATIAGLPLLAAGLVVVRPPARPIFGWWIAGFAVTMLLANEPHFDHDYYQLPLVFVTGMLMGMGADWWSGRPRRRLLVTALCLGMVGCSVWELRWMLRRSDNDIRLVAFGRAVSELTPPDARLIFLYNRIDPRRGPWVQHRTSYGEVLFHAPFEFYLSHRKGWSLAIGQISPRFVEVLRQRGATHLATRRARDLDDLQLRTWLDCAHEQVALPEHVDGAIYRLVSARRDCARP